MTLAPDPSDTTDAKTDAKADGNFGSAGSHRAGYGDKLANAERWARKGGTLNAGEGLILCEEIDRLREALKHETQWADAGIDSTAFWQQQRDDLTKKLAEVTDERDAAEANAERRWDDMVQLRERLTAVGEERDNWRQQADVYHRIWKMEVLEGRTLRRILDALREPSIHIWEASVFTLDAEQNMNSAIRAAVAAAEQEVQGER